MSESTSSTRSGEQKADVGITGLATMGRNLARNLARQGHRVAAHNRTTEKMTALVEDFGDEGEFVGAETLQELVDALETPRVVLVMVKAGEATDAVLKDLAPLLEDGDIVVDAGNAHFADTIRREEELAEHGVRFVGMGVSGGEEGALNGPSIMVGGSDESYERLGPLVESIAAVVDGRPCAAHLGPDGAGHYVKMVHNGIEYADMQLIAEAYDLMRRHVGLDAAACAEVFRTWNEGDLSSFLVEISAQVLDHSDADTGKPFVDVVRDAAEQKGTGRWTVQSALDLGVPVTGIAEATFARALSGDTETREATAKAFGPADESGSAGSPLSGEDRDSFLDDLGAALYAAKLVAYAQGFGQLAAASEEHDWNLDLGEVAAIWRDGCIIRAQFLDDITQAFDAHPDLPTLLAADAFVEVVNDGIDAWRRVVVAGVQHAVPLPAFSTTLAYFDALRSEVLPTRLIQGLRDLFGAHTYERVDREGTFHTRWADDGQEESAD